MTRVLGLDLSLVATGVAKGDDTWTLASKKLRGVERLAWFKEQVRELVHDVDVVALEGYSFGSRGRAIFDLGELGGVVRLELYWNEVPFVEIPPARVKKFVTGKGNAGKDEVIVAAVKRLGFGGVSNNEADAWGMYVMALCHYGSPGFEFSPTKDQKAVVESIEWPEIG